MKIKSSTTLRNDYNTVSNLAHETQEPIYITKNGEGDAVFMSVDAFENREKILQHRAAVLEAEFSRLNGDPTYSIDDIRAMLRRSIRMPKYDIRILTPAWQDIERIADVHMLSVGPKSAEAITNKLMGKIELLLEQPLMGALHSDEFLAMRQFRKMICGNYIIIYKLVDTTVFIYRVVDGRTNYLKLFY